MSKYIFILGNNEGLSIAELRSVYPENTIEVLSDKAVLIECDEKISQKDFDRIGGSLKMGELLDVVGRDELLNRLFSFIEESHKGVKLHYGISVYGWPTTAGRAEKNLRLILSDLKKKLKKAELSTRFANQDFSNISSAQYKGLRALGGEEYIIVKCDSDFFIAKTVAVQNIDAYSKRDYDKPYRDMNVGMLPPKLAQIMINLAGKAKCIWDPFCGGGVLLMEGLMMGRNMIGSDINERTLEGATDNIEWFKKEFNIKDTVNLYVHDATTSQSDVKFDAIVCEGYLGPPRHYVKSADSLRSLIDELNTLYTGFFKAIKDIGFRGPVVIALPFFRCTNGCEIGLEHTIAEVEKMGFTLKAKPLKYARNDQIVGREIFLFKS